MLMSFQLASLVMVESSVTRIKSPNVYKGCPKKISQEKLQILKPLQKLSKNVEDLGKLIIAKGYKKLPKVQNIALVKPDARITDNVETR